MSPSAENKILFRAKLRFTGAWREFFMGICFFQAAKAQNRQPRRETLARLGSGPGDARYGSPEP